MPTRDEVDAWMAPLNRPFPVISTASRIAPGWRVTPLPPDYVFSVEKPSDNSDKIALDQIRALPKFMQPKRARDMITLARAEPPKPAAPVVYGEEPNWMKRMRQPSWWRRFLRWCGL